MVSKMSWKSWVVLGAAVALFVASGGLLMASNMGFKINKALSNGNVTNSNKGVNFVSIPFNNPYVNYRGLCQAFESQFGQAVTANVNVEEIDASTGAAVNQLCLGCCPAATPTVCGGAGANCNATLVRNAGLPGVRIRITGTTASSPTNIVLVGSSIETQATPTLFQIAVANSNNHHNWISVPYHATWVKAFDVCTTVGATALTSAVSISRIDSTGSTLTFNCGGSATLASNFNLVVGEGIRILKTNSANPPTLTAFVPPHF